MPLSEVTTNLRDMPQTNYDTRRHTVQDATILTSRTEYEIRDAIDKGELPASVEGQQYQIRTDDLAVWATSLEQASS